MLRSTNCNDMGREDGALLADCLKVPDNDGGYHQRYAVGARAARRAGELSGQIELTVRHRRGLQQGRPSVCAWIGGAISVRAEMIRFELQKRASVLLAE